MTAVSTGGRRLIHAAVAAKKLALDEGRQFSRQELASAARDAMKALNLRPTLRLVLGELVGCWGEVLIKDRVLVWPSNEYLTQRTGLSERAVRYGIRGLQALQIVTAKDSANGKRFAIKGAGGAVLDAFGFDLTPLYVRRMEWRDKVERIRREDEALRRLYDELTICRRATEEALIALASNYPDHDRQELEARFETLKTEAPRRSSRLARGSLETIVESWRAISRSAEEEFYKAGYGGKSCLLIETNNGAESPCQASEPPNEAVRREDPSPTPAFLSLKLILEACPALSAFHRPILSEADLIDAGRYLRGSLGAHESAWNEAIEGVGALKAAALVAITLQLHEDDVASGTTRIQNPGGYFRSLVRLMQAGRFELERELLALRRKRIL